MTLLLVLAFLASCTVYCFKQATKPEPCPHRGPKIGVPLRKIYAHFSEPCPLCEEEGRSVNGKYR